MKNNCEIRNWPTLKQFPLPAKVLVTAIILTMAVGMVGALAQIILHDIIPTFISSDPNPKTLEAPQDAPKSEERGDLFSSLPESTPKKLQEPFYRNEQFVWTLKWTHIHLFGMSTIFISDGCGGRFSRYWSRRACLADCPPFFGNLDRHCVDVAEGLYFPGFFLAAHTGRRTFRRDLRLRFNQRALRNVVRDALIII